MVLNPASAGRPIKVRTVDEQDGRTRYMVWCGPNRPMIAILKASGAYCDVRGSKRWIFWRSSDAATERQTFQKLCQVARVDYENLED